MAEVREEKEGSTKVLELYSYEAQQGSMQREKKVFLMSSRGESS